MKSLINYIKENREINEAELKCENKKLNFDGMDDAKEIIKQLKDMNGVTVEENEVTIDCNASIDDLKKIYEIVRPYSDSQRRSQHRSSDEAYAQRTIKFEKSVNELDEMIMKIENPEPEEEKEKCDGKECKDKKEEE